MFNPLVSIIIPVYNGSNYMQKAIDSALAQTYKNTEVIVVNDGSKDDGKTEEVALSYGSKIRYFYKENGGVSSALNLGIKNMKGEYISWLSHDDEYTSTKIENQICNVQQCDMADVFLCDDVQIDELSNLIGGKFQKKTECGLIDAKDMLHRLLKYRSIDGCSLLIHKSVFEKCGFFDESLRYNQDFDMWVKFCLNGFDWYHSCNVDVKSRVHKQQVTQTRKDLFYKDSEALSKTLIPQLIAISSKKNNYFYEYTKRAAKNNCQAVVKNCFYAEKTAKMFSLKDRVVIYTTSLYGKIRPFFRRLYYRIFKKVKIKL